MLDIDNKKSKSSCNSLIQDSWQKWMIVGSLKEQEPCGSRVLVRLRASERRKLPDQAESHSHPSGWGCEQRQ